MGNDFVKEIIEEVSEIDLISYKKKFEKLGFIFENGSFEDNTEHKEQMRCLYFELKENDEEYIVFVQIVLNTKEILYISIFDRKDCTFS